MGFCSQCLTTSDHIALDGACCLLVILLPGTVMQHADSCASFVQGQNSLTAQVGGSADPAAEQAVGSLGARQGGRQAAAGSTRGPSTLLAGLRLTASTASPSTVAGAGHLLQIADASATASRLTAGPEVSMLVLGSARCIGVYICQLLGCGWFQPCSSCVLMSTWMSLAHSCVC